MPTLPNTLYSASQVRELDRIAIEERGIPGIVLMKRAARATLEALLERWPSPQCITVYCGAGNNGGDGYIVAALARQQGIPVAVIQVASPEKLTGDARRAFEFASQDQVTFLPCDQAATPDSGVVVDAMLGTGATGTVRGEFETAIRAINASGLPVVAVDIPSGLCSDTGAILGDCVAANLTVSFIGLKRGLLTGRGPAFTGELVFDDLDVPDDIYDQVRADARVLDWPHLVSLLVPRPADAHKGLFGHVMIIGGELGYGGAVVMAAEAALCAGAGLVSAATRPEHVPAVLARCPEVMAVGVTSGQSLEPWLSRPTVLVIGPGLGRTPWSEQMLQKAVASGLPMVVDADALNILSEGRVAANADSANWLLTPHPGEAARLLGIESADVQNDRFAAVTALQKKYGGTVLLKGAGTLIASGSVSGTVSETDSAAITLCPYGNPGMATGGMGDVLSGVLGALLAQGLNLAQAAELGACVHALAADDVAGELGQFGLRATDLFAPLRARFNQNLAEGFW